MPPKKKKSIPSQWNRSIVKQKRQSGLEYMSGGGKIVKSKLNITKACMNKCVFKCEQNIKMDCRLVINQKFWSLSDGEKNHFYNKFVQRSLPKRKRTQAEASRKGYSFKYYFEIEEQRFNVILGKGDRE